MSDRIAVVDDNNRFIRWTDRQEIHGHHLPHRSVQVLLFDSRGRLVLQKRHRDKLTYASHWDMSCSGHIEESDYPNGPDDDLDSVYLEVAHRELKEELGIDTELTLLGAFAPEPGVHYEHLQLFKGVHDGPYVAQPEELEAIEAVDAETFDAWARDPAVPLTLALIHFVEWARERGHW